MPDGKGRYENEHLFPVLEQVNGSQGSDEKDMIQCAGTQDMLPAGDKIKPGIMHTYPSIVSVGNPLDLPNIRNIASKLKPVVEMKALLYKCFLLIVCAAPAINASSPHPIYVSVTEITHNPQSKSLEISCRLFTDDLEKALRKLNPGRIDLLNASIHKEMEPRVSRYIKDHLQLEADGKQQVLSFLGYEQQEDAIAAYFEVVNLPAVKKISIYNNLLYEYQPQQMGIIHATVNGERKSHRLLNPESKVVMEW